MQLRHLVEQGHTAVATALPDAGSPLAATRLKFTGLSARDLGIRTPGTFVAPPGRAACAEAVRAFLTGAPEVTAVAGFNDDIALRVLMALRDLGHRVPDDVAVIGFDDNGYGAYTTPGLTSVHVYAEAHGRLSARLALGLGADGLHPPPARIVVRQSA
ncbi:substrate-binding domain-containing protein [Streptomyces pimonensis]|uniref:substrate-binding domain-containing protein n=1 Tax=Streptomyces pimonensis TaxID=2860288 RepID=UPI003526F72E